MELYIAEYLVENGYANDMVSALKILKVASDDWKQELCENISQELAMARREIQQLMQRGRPVPPELHAKAAKLAKQAKDEANIGAVLSRDKPKPKRVPGLGERPQTPSSGVRAARDPRLGPTAAQRRADRTATRLTGSEVEKGATYIRRNADGTTTRVRLKSTEEPLNIRSDATRRERRSGSSRTTERPEIGRQGRPDRSAEDAPRSFRRENK